MSRTSKFSNEKYIKHQNIYEKHSILTKENSNYRIITKNLVYIIGLSDSISEKGILIKYEYLGQYGKITKIVINKKKAYNLNNRFGPSFSAYVTYSSPEEASIAILSLDNIIVENHLIRASFGTTKYCQFFLKGLECNNKDCVYLHKKAKEEDIIKRDELSSNKNLFYIQQLYAIKIANIYNPEVKKKSWLLLIKVLILSFLRLIKFMKMKSLLKINLKIILLEVVKIANIKIIQAIIIKIIIIIIIFQILITKKIIKKKKKIQI